MKLTRSDVLQSLAGMFRRPEEKALLQALTQTPEGAAMLARGETENLQMRRALVAELDNLHANTSPTITAAQKVTAAADRRLNLARAELASAKEEYARAQIAETGLSVTAESLRGRLERELRDGADPRLEQAIEIVLDLVNIARHRLAIGVDTKSDWFGRSRNGLVTNGKELTRAVMALNDCVGDLVASQLQARSFDETTEQLRAIAGRARAAGALIDLREHLFVTADGAVQMGGTLPTVHAAEAARNPAATAVAQRTAVFGLGEGAASPRTH